MGTDDNRTNPILLVHGAWHGPWCWTENWTSYLEEADFAVSTIDLNGSPLGSQERRWTRMSSYVNAVRAEIDHLGSDVIVVGHSMGGLIAQRALERSSARGLVLLASVPATGVAMTTVRMLRRAPGAVLRSISGLNMWPLVATEALTRDAFFTHTTAADVVKDAQLKLRNESYIAYLSMMVRWARPGQVDSPALVIAAEHDPLFTVAQQAHLASRYGTEAAVINGAGHDLMLDTDWQQPADLVVKWAAELDKS